MFKKRKFVSLMIIALMWSLQFVPAQAAQHAFGSNIITPQGTVFTITQENNQTVRRPYTSPGAFLSYSFNTWDTIVGASAEDMTLPVGSFIAPQDGKIICSDRGSDKGTCYLITNGQKAGFTSEGVFRKFGYSFNHVMSGDVSFLPSTSNIDTPTTAHSPGTLINKDGTVYLVGKTGLYGIPDWATLESWGYTSADIVTANSADRNLPYIAMLPSRQPQYLAPLNNLSPDNSANSGPSNNTSPSTGPSAANPWLTLRLDHPVQLGQPAQAGQINLSFGKAGFAAYDSDITIKSIGITGEVAQTTQTSQSFANIKVYDSSTNALVGQTSTLTSSDNSASGAAKHFHGTVYFSPAIVVSQTSVKFLEIKAGLASGASGNLRLGIEGIDASAQNFIYIRDGLTGNPFYLDGYTIPSTNPTPTPTPTSTPSISITSPNGGEKFLKGSQQSIQWTSSNISSVNIQLYKAESFYSNITSAGYPINNQNYYSWSIPSSLPDGTDYQVKITDANSNTFAQSSSNFSILFSSQADTLVTALSPINPPAGQVTRGQTGAAILAVDLTNTTQQTINISQVTFVCQGCASIPDFSNVYLYLMGPGQIGSMQPASADHDFFTFNLGNSVSVSANSKQTLLVKVDIASPGSGFTNQNFYLEFRSATATDSNGSVVIQGTPLRSYTFTIQ